MEIPMKVTKNVNAKTLSLNLKVCDRFCASLLDENGETIADQEDGYVPGFMPGQHYGDYVQLDIDIDTGQITNWSPPSADELMQFANPTDDD